MTMTKEQAARVARDAKRRQADLRRAVELRKRGWIVAESTVGPVVAITDDVLRAVGGFGMDHVALARTVLEAAGCSVPLHNFEVQRAERLQADARRILGI